MIKSLYYRQDCTSHCAINIVHSDALSNMLTSSFSQMRCEDADDQKS